MRKFLVAIFSVVAFSFADSAHANTILSTTDGKTTDPNGEDYLLGEVFVPGDIQGGQETRDAAAVNGLLKTVCVDAGGCYSETTNPSYYRSEYDFGQLDAAVTTGAQISGGSINVSGNYAYLTLNQTYQYLIVTYDGQNGGAAVWYTGGIAAGETLQFARYAYPTGTENDNQHLVENYSTTQYGITHWTLLNPTGPVSVPDGGATAVLLGLSMLGLGVARRRKN